LAVQLEPEGAERVVAETPVGIPAGVLKAGCEFQVLDVDKSSERKEIATESDSRPDSAFYANEIDDILQIMARAEIGIENILNEKLKRQLKSKLSGPNKLSLDDCAAILQMIAFMELDVQASAQILNADGLHKNTSPMKVSVQEGPLTRNHLQVFRLLCTPDLHLEHAGPDQMHAPLDSGDQSRESIKYKQSAALRNEAVSTESGDLDSEQDIAVIKIVKLLDKYELQPSYLLHRECRDVLEGNLVNRQRQGPLSSEQLAILQLLSKAEIDSGTAPTSERKRLLEKRLRQGPLSSSDLGVLAELANYDPKDFLPDRDSLWAEAPAGAERVVAETPTERTAAPPFESTDHKREDGTQTVSPGTESRAHPEEKSPDGNAPEDASSPIAQPRRSRASVSDDSFPGQATRISLLSMEEKARVQQLELRLKTDRILQAIPEWVRQGLLPPPRQPEAPSPGSLPPPAGGGGGGGGDSQSPPGPSTSMGGVHSDRPVLISSSMCADLGFLVSLDQPTAPAKPRDLFHADGELFARPETRTTCATSPSPVTAGPAVGQGMLPHAEVALPGAFQAAAHAGAASEPEAPGEAWPGAGRIRWLVGGCCPWTIRP
jgi:hypothetical protein